MELVHGSRDVRAARGGGGLAGGVAGGGGGCGFPSFMSTDTPPTGRESHQSQWMSIDENPTSVSTGSKVPTSRGMRSLPLPEEAAPV